MNYLDFDRHPLRQRNEEMLREVQELRLGERLRANRGIRPERSRTNNLTWRTLLSLLDGAGLSK